MFVKNLTFLIMTTKHLSPEKQLQLIEETIAQAKENLSKHSYPFIFWGWFVSLTALVNYLLLVFSSLGGKAISFGPSRLFWVLFQSAFYYRKAEKTERHLTHLEYFLSRLWIVFGLILLLFTVGIGFMRHRSLVFLSIYCRPWNGCEWCCIKIHATNTGRNCSSCIPFLQCLFWGQFIIAFIRCCNCCCLFDPGYLLKRQSE
jgi:hypothetical protein